MLICLLYTHLLSYKLTCFPIHSSTFLHTRLPICSSVFLYAHVPSYMLICLLHPHLPSHTLTCLPIQSSTFLYAHMPSYILTCFPTCPSTFLYAHLTSNTLICLSICSPAFLYTHSPSCTLTCLPIQSCCPIHRGCWQYLSPELEQCLHRHAARQACTTPQHLQPYRETLKTDIKGKNIVFPSRFPSSQLCCHPQHPPFSSTQGQRHCQEGKR